MIITLAVVTVVGAVAFVVIERRTEEPLLNVRYFRSPALTGAVLTAIVAFLALGGFLFFNTLYLQDVRGYQPLNAGLLTVPVTIVTLVFAPLAGRVTGIHGPRAPVVVACGCIAGAMAALSAVLTPDLTVLVLIACYAVLGAGMGLVNPPITNAAVSSMPVHEAGVASATTSTARQIGTNLGVALLGSIVFSAVAGSALASNSGVLPAAVGQQFVDGLRAAYAVTAGLAVLCGAYCWRAFREPGPAGAATGDRRSAVESLGRR